MNDQVKISPAKMAAVGAGWLGASFFWAFHSSSMPLFLSGFTDSKFRIALVLSLAGITGCLVPPVVGYLSDRTHTRFGRRSPYIFIGMLGLLLCVAVLPHFEAFGVVALVSGLMYFFISFAQAPYMSLLPDVTPPEQRGTASGVMNLLGSIGLIMYFIVGLGIWDKNPIPVFYIVAVVSFAATMVTIVLVKEHTIADEGTPGTFDFVTHLKATSKETEAMKFLAASFCFWLSFWMVFTFFTLFCVEVHNVSEGRSMLAPLAYSIVSTIMVLPLGMLGDRLDRRKILSFMLGLSVVFHLLMMVSRNFTDVLIIQALIGIPCAAMMGVGYAFFLDLIPEERTAEFVGFYIISMAAPQIFGPMLSGKLIDVLGYHSIFPVAAAFLVIELIILQFIRPAPAKADAPSD